MASNSLSYYNDFLESIVIKNNKNDFGIILIIAKSGHPYIKVIYRDNDESISSVFLTLFGYEYAFNTYKRYFDKNFKKDVVNWIEERKESIKQEIEERYSKHKEVKEIIYN